MYAEEGREKACSDTSGVALKCGKEIFLNLFRAESNSYESGRKVVFR